MESSAHRLARRFKAEAHQVQLDELVKKVAQAVRAVVKPGIDTKTLAKGVVKKVLQQDSDGSLLGTVYSDSFNRNQFLRTLTRALNSYNAAPQVAEEILLELEDQK